MRATRLAIRKVDVFIVTSRIFCTDCTQIGKENQTNALLSQRFYMKHSRLHARTMRFYAREG